MARIFGRCDQRHMYGHEIVTMMADEGEGPREVAVGLPEDKFEDLYEDGWSTATGLGSVEMGDDVWLYVRDVNRWPGDMPMRAVDVASCIAPFEGIMRERESAEAARMDAAAEAARGGKPLFHMDGATYGLPEGDYALYFGKTSYVDGAIAISAYVDWAHSSDGDFPSHGAEPFFEVTTHGRGKVGLTRHGYVDEANFPNDEGRPGLTSFLVENGLAEETGLSSGGCPFVRFTDRMFDACVDLDASARVPPEDVASADVARSDSDEFGIV